MKKLFIVLCISGLASNQVKSQIFINTTSTTNNTDPTYHNGSVTIGKTTAGIEKLDVEGNIALPYGNFFGLNNSNLIYRKLMLSTWDASYGNGDCLSFYTAGGDPLNQYEKMRITMSGKIGIGTDNPKARLHVYESNALVAGYNQSKLLTSVSGNTGSNSFHHNDWILRDNTGIGNWWDVRLQDGISIDNTFNDPYTNSKTWWRRQPYLNEQSWGDGSTTNMILKQGRLGINWGSPAARLDIAETDNNFVTLLARDMHTVDGLYCIMASVTRDLTKAFTVGNNLSGYKEPFVVYGNGQTKIGLKSSSAHANAMLMVDGKVVCKDLYVTATSDWPDFVFAANYKLANIYEVRDYYEAHKHLPNVPTACEIEEKGINISEISNIQMQKIEELTLYIVQLKIELDALKKEISLKK